MSGSGTMKFIITLIGLLVVISSVFPGGLSIAETDRSGKGVSIRELIINLNKHYLYLEKELKKLEEGIRGFPRTTLSLSIIKAESDIDIVSIELLDEDKLLKSHIYTPVENQALDAGGRHQFYYGEIEEGSHRFKVIYYWKEGNGPPKKGEIVFNLSIPLGRKYFVEIAFERKGDVVEPRLSQLDFITR